MNQYIDAVKGGDKALKKLKAPDLLLACKEFYLENQKVGADLERQKTDTRKEKSQSLKLKEEKEKIEQKVYLALYVLAFVPFHIS